MASSKVRTRFAPSPTGDPHLGNIRTALFNYLFARHQRGEWLVRIEDTDQERKVAGAEERTLESLAWLDLEYDGELVRQSERLAEYQPAAEKLVADGRAYYCTCSQERLKKLRDEQRKRKEPPRYDQHCLGKFDVRPAKAIVRFRVPDKVSPFTDELRGEVQIDASQIDDFVILKSDGYPTYNFANAVDDHWQRISHVIRGEEFLSSTPKHLLIFAAFGWPPPKLVHLPVILGPDKGKLSKRHGAKPVLEYRDDGYLPVALTNFLALLGWRGEADRELYTKDELIQAFSLSGVQKSPAVFDEQKLRWMNGEYMKRLDTGELVEMMVTGGFWKVGDLAYDTKVLKLAAERTKTLKELATVQNSFYYKAPKITAKQLVGTNNSESIGAWLERTKRALEGVTDWQPAAIETALTDLREELTLTPQELYPVLRVAVSGQPQTPALWDVFAVLGKEETLRRLEQTASLVS